MRISSIPIIPWIFPLTSVYSNLDLLFWRVAIFLDEREKQHCFPWILWFLWKDMNKKIFEGIQVEPIDILNLALHEQVLWEDAQSNLVETMGNMESLDTSSHKLRCQIDNSWK